MTAPAQAGQGHLADNLEKQLNEIMVQMGRIFQAPTRHPERADQIVLNAKKKVGEATDSFHSTLDEMEMEITRAKAVFMRDLQRLQDKKKAAAAPSQAQPPAPMVIELEPPKVEQVSVPVAPMMASVSPFMQNRPSLKVSESKPVAPFPDMGMGTATHAATVPFHPVKAPEPKRPSPNPASKSGPPSGRPPSKPFSQVTSQKQTNKAPATVPPAASSVTRPPATAQPAPNPPAARNAFTNATFTLDPANNRPQAPPAGQDNTMDLTGFDNTASYNDLGLGGPASGGTAESNSISAGNETNMDDLDHFFDIGEESNTNFDDNFNNMNEFMNDDFAFDTFE